MQTRYTATLQVFAKPSMRPVRVEFDAPTLAPSGELEYLAYREAANQGYRPSITDPITVRPLGAL